MKKKFFVGMIICIFIQIGSKNSFSIDQKEAWPIITNIKKIKSIIEEGFYKIGHYYYDISELSEAERKKAMQEIKNELIQSNNYTDEPLAFVPSYVKNNQECIYNLKLFDDHFVTLNVKRVDSLKDKTNYSPAHTVVRTVYQKWNQLNAPDNTASKEITSLISVASNKKADQHTKEIQQFYLVLSAIPRDILKKYVKDELLK